MKISEEKVILFKALIPNGFVIYVGETIDSMGIDDWVKLVMYVIVGLSTSFYYISKGREARRNVKN